MSDLYTLTRGDGPLLISIPHLGTQIPDALRPRYSQAALALADTDWHLDQLYAFGHALGATVLGARVSRYVIDLNRPLDGSSLYPGQTTTGLCPTETFRGEALYPPGQEPGKDEIARRIETYWLPYHSALAGELARLRTRHPHVLLWEAHSIVSVLPRLFEGKLPDLNIGTQEGRTAHPAVQGAVQAAATASPFTSVVNGRFKGGHITRHFGAPERGIHAIQLEMCQSLYMDEQAPFAYRPDLAGAVQPTLWVMIDQALQAMGKLDPVAAGAVAAG